MNLKPYGSALNGRYQLDLTEVGERYIGHPKNVENVHLSLGLACNLSCGHCPVNRRGEVARKYKDASQKFGEDLGDPRRFTHPDLLEAVLELFPNVEQIGLGCGGGEPMLHPQYEKFLKISRDFFAAKAEAIPGDKRLLWWTNPYDYGNSVGSHVDVHKGGRVVLFTNAARMPQDERGLKEYLLKHPNVTFEVSYDGFHEESYRQHGMDFGKMIATLGKLAGDRDVQNAGVQIYLFHVGDQKIDALEREFPHCLVNTSSVIKISPDSPPSTRRGGRHSERHAIFDSQGNSFTAMNDIYSGNLDFLCGNIREVRKRQARL